MAPVKEDTSRISKLLLGIALYVIVINAHPGNTGAEAAMFFGVPLLKISDKS
jgi:hypothetical protein